MTKEEKRVIKQAYDLLYEAGTKFPVASKKASDRRNRAAALLKRVLVTSIEKELNNVHQASANISK